MMHGPINIRFSDTIFAIALYVLCLHSSVDTHYFYKNLSDIFICHVFTLRKSCMWTLFKKCFFGCSKNSSSVRHNTTDWPNQLAAQWDYVTLERLAWRSRARVYLCSKRRLKKDTLSAAQCIVVPVKSCNKWCFCSMVYQVMSFLSSSVQSYVIGSTCPTAVRVFSWSDKRTSPGRNYARFSACL